MPVPDLLVALGLVQPASNPEVTRLGRQYVEAEFIKHDRQASLRILQEVLLRYKPAATLTQLLYGVPRADRASAATALRLQGFGDGLNERNLGALLSLMNRSGLIAYAKGKGTITVKVHVAAEEKPPPTILITPKTPYANRVWLRRILEECTGFIYWLDKHFLPTGFEALWEAADGKRISLVRILSLQIAENSSPKALKTYEHLQQDMSLRSISLEWRYIDSGKIKNDHDRWIIGANSARNVPNVNAIFSGQYSELNLSDSHKVLQPIFDTYWAAAVPVERALEVSRSSTKSPAA